MTGFNDAFGVGFRAPEVRSSHFCSGLEVKKFEDQEPIRLEPLCNLSKLVIVAVQATLIYVHDEIPSVGSKIKSSMGVMRASMVT